MEENKDMREWELQQELADNLLDHGKTTISELLASAPNSPELTRLSGEQAEERAVREGRASDYVRKLMLPDPNAETEDHFILKFPRASEIVEGREFWLAHLPELLAAYALSECSRLASRVEELEKILKPLIDVAKMYRQYTYSPEIINAHITKAEKLLAGAHAEEKE